MAFSENDILSFIHELTIRGDEKSLPYTLFQLAELLETDGADKKYVNMVSELSTVNKEAAELKEFKDLTPEQIHTAIKRGKQRLKREEEERRRSHC